MAKRRQKRKLNKNPTALISAMLLIFSGFLFQLFNTNFTGTIYTAKHYTMSTYLISILGHGPDFASICGRLDLLLCVTFILSISLFLLNGFGIIYNRYSQYASYFTFIYLIIGLVLYEILSKENMSVLGIQVMSTVLGPGVYFVPIVGIFYLIFKKKVNSRIRI